MLDEDTVWALRVEWEEALKTLKTLGPQGPGQNYAIAFADGAYKALGYVLEIHEGSDV